MSIWTALFFVVSVVMLASPFLSARDADRKGSGIWHNNNGWDDWEENELRLDLAAGRLAREDFEAMIGRSRKECG